MKSIAFLIRALTVGGAQRQLIELARGLQDRGWRVTVLTFYDGGGLAGELTGTGVNVVSLQKRGRWDVAGFAWRLVRAVRRERPSILHPYMPDSNVMVTLLRPFLGSVRIVWGIRASDMDLTKYDWLSGLSFRVSVFLSRFADSIICNSHSGASFHRRNGYPGHGMAVVHNGIDVTRFRPDAAARARGRQRWGVCEGERLIGIVGRLDPMKDHETFLRAAALMRDSVPEARFVCVGEGMPDHAARLRAIADSLGVTDRVTWTGTDQDLVAVYNALDVCTLCSAFGEGFPNVLGEAMACSTPCVVTDVGDARFVLGDDTRVAAVRDADGLQRAWKAALDTPADARRRLRERIVEEFSVEALVENSERVLTEAAR